ncbi:NB-ARC domains-containing protein [Tanacetum coccineum]
MFPRVVKMFPPQITGFPSLQRPVEEIVSLFSNNNEFNIIRLSGFPGSGKTTILQTVNDHPTVEDLFDIVLWVEVSTKNRTVDEQLICRLKLTIDPRENKNIQIRMKLERYKFLILIDDVNEKLDLKAIGIPTTHIGSSMVITTNQPHILCDPIGTRCIGVPKLDDEESRYLFHSIIRCPDFLEKASIKSLITKILRRCGNNPLFIKAAAKEFKSRKDKQSWEDGVYMMRIWPHQACAAMKESFDVFRTFLDSLPDEELLSMYYISLYTEESMIFSRGLIQNLIADGGILKPQYTYHYGDDPDDVSMQIDGRTVVNILILRNLLDGDVEQNAVSMSKFVRQLVLFNVQVSRKVETIIRSGDRFSCSPPEKHWESAKWVSLESTNISILPERPLYPLLTTLFLNKNDSLTHIPESFFENMATLHVLLFNEAKIKVLPVSITKLLLLRVLVLRNCRDLGEVPSDFGQMRSLKVVDIRGCGLLVVPC